jgi:hypothetical protein
VHVAEYEELDPVADTARQVEIRLPSTKNLTLPGAFVVTVIVAVTPLYKVPEKVGAPKETVSFALVTVKVTVTESLRLPSETQAITM